MRPADLERFHFLVFVVRGDAGVELANAKLARDGLGGARVVAGEHEEVEAQSTQLIERLRRRGLDRVRHRQKPGGTAVHRREDGGRALRLETARRVFETPAVSAMPFSSRNAGLPTRTRRPPTVPDTPPPVVD